MAKPNMFEKLNGLTPTTNKKEAKEEKKPSPFPSWYKHQEREGKEKSPVYTPEQLALLKKVPPRLGMDVPEPEDD